MATQEQTDVAGAEARTTICPLGIPSLLRSADTAWAMSQENVEVVRAVYERWGEGDFRAILAVVDPLVLFVQRPPLPESGTYLGIERLVEYTRGFLEPWRHITIEAQEIADADGSVVATVRQRGVGSGSGAETELRYFQVWSFRGRKVIRLENFQERSEALEAAGLSE